MADNSSYNILNEAEFGNQYTKYVVCGIFNTGSKHLAVANLNNVPNTKEARTQPVFLIKWC